MNGRHAGVDRSQTRASNGHVAHFYEDEAFLCDEAARYIARGLAAGEPALIIATEAHQQVIRLRLQSSGLDVEQCTALGQLTWLEAQSTLAAVQRDDQPDWDLFEAAITPVLDRIRHQNRTDRMLIFGDALDVLWRRGALQSAILLEQMWNRLRERYDLSVLCGYTVERFNPDAEAQLRQVCGEHDQVRTPEARQGFTDRTEALVEIRLLQRRTCELEREIQRRIELEEALCEALEERCRAEEALRQSQEDLRDYFENALEGLHWVGPDGRILWANRAQLDLLGYSREEYVGHHITEFHVDRELIEACMAQLAGNEALHDQEAQLRCKDGSIKHVLVHSNALFRNGKFVHSRCFIRDTTARKSLEQDLQARMAELAEAARRKDEFLAVLGHELRNPLGSISSVVELLRRTRALSDVDHAQLAGEIRRMTQILDDLLDVSRITHGKIQLRCRSAPVVELIRSAVQTIQPLIDARGHDIAVLTPHPPLYVWADPLRIEQVLGNLIGNAVKYSEPGTRIEISAEGAGEEVILMVKDQGIGIGNEFLPRLFDPFVQEARAAERTEGGLGIGLTVARHLVELHGGRIDASSEGPGKGSRFVVRLPAAGAEALCASRPQLKPQTVTQPVCRQVLIVEDNRNAAISLGRLVELMGHKVRIAHDGKAALEAARDRPPDVVLLDLGLPKMAGTAVAEALRQMPGMQNVLLVAMTGYGQERDRERTRRSGFNAHLVKPVPADVLEQLLLDGAPPEDTLNPRSPGATASKVLRSRG